MPVTSPRRSFGPALAVIAAVAVVGLAIRLGVQISALDAARSDLANAQQTASDLRSATTAGLGPALLDGRMGKPADLLAQDLARLGIKPQSVQMVGATPAGRGLTVARFIAEGRADPAAVDHVALWAKANPRSTILEALSLSGAGGDVRIELDALVHEAGPGPT
ncbi:MAG TPA: hypothetical protein VGI95_02515 [Caulobacteraceae bacterium]|jgi:hypothetical protein